RSVHNICIECLWVDITAQLGATWADRFIMLEVQHGLNINSANHIWLLHYLFLNTINQQLNFLAESWNQHCIWMGHGPNCSPADMFGFDMFVHGMCGGPLPTPEVVPLLEEELEVYGVDWEGLHNDGLLQSCTGNNVADEGSGSWVGCSRPPENLNEVHLDAPSGVFTQEEILAVDVALVPLAGAAEDVDVARLWVEGLALARAMLPNEF
ncbi:hypothetical protein L208DRAFT_1331987, partial [Tricholoma matsutake]